MTALIQRLEEHVRFEEQTLFPAMERALGRARLAELEGELALTREDFEIGSRGVSSEACSVGAGGAGGTTLSDS